MITAEKSHVLRQAASWLASDSMKAEICGLAAPSNEKSRVSAKSIIALQPYSMYFIR